MGSTLQFFKYHPLDGTEKKPILQDATGFHVLSKYCLAVYRQQLKSFARLQN